MNRSILRLSVCCTLTLAALAAGGRTTQTVAAQIIPVNGPYLLTGNSVLNYVGSSHVWDPASSHLYTSTRGGIYEFDVTSMKVVGRTPSVRSVGSMSFDASRNELYSLALHSNEMQVVDVTTKAVVRSFAAPAWYNVFYEAGRGELYYLRGDTRELRIADRLAGKTIKSLTLAGTPSFLAADPAHHRVLVRLADKDQIQIIDTTDREITGAWPARADGQSAMAIDPTGDRVFVSTGRDVAVLDGTTGKELSRFGTGDGTQSIVYDSNTHFVVALSYDGRVNVAKFEADRLTPVQSFGAVGIQELFLDPKTHKVFGVTRAQDDGVMRDLALQDRQPTMAGGSTLLTLTLTLTK